ncbi:LLM class flavin-dependent oxidoreductase [Candidatus Bathyarchaeota archaeon]|nr:LLM class flavin-dependent oxidoreductase [Candidatus Bathyarchaeota archaeon]
MNVWSCLTAYAMVTEKVHLVTLVTDPCRMHPTVLAQTVITIDKISNG